MILIDCAGTHDEPLHDLGFCSLTAEKKMTAISELQELTISLSQPNTVT